MSRVLGDEVSGIFAEILLSCLWWKLIGYFLQHFRKEKAQWLALVVKSSPASPAKQAGSKCKSDVVTIRQKLGSYLMMKGFNLQFRVPNVKAWKSIILSITSPDVTNRYTALLAGQGGSSSLAQPKGEAVFPSRWPWNELTAWCMTKTSTQAQG